MPNLAVDLAAELRYYALLIFTFYMLKSYADSHFGSDFGKEIGA